MSQQRSCHPRDPRVEEPSTAPGAEQSPVCAAATARGQALRPRGGGDASKQRAGTRRRSPTPLRWHWGLGSPLSIAGCFLLCREGPEQPGPQWCHVSLSWIPRTSGPVDPSPDGVRSTPVPGCAPYALDLCTASASGTVCAGCSVRTLPLARPELHRPTQPGPKHHADPIETTPPQTLHTPYPLKVGPRASHTAQPQYTMGVGCTADPIQLCPCAPHSQGTL